MRKYPPPPPQRVDSDKDRRLGGKKYYVGENGQLHSSGGLGQEKYAFKMAVQYSKHRETVPCGEGGESALQADVMTKYSCFCMPILLSAAPAALNLNDSKLFVDLRFTFTYIGKLGLFNEITFIR